MPAVRSLLLAVVMTAGAVGVGVALDGSSSGGTPTPPAVASLRSLDTTILTVPRGSFCSAVATAAVHRALGAAPTAASTYGNGERALVAPGVRDVSHEYACSWRAGHATARAWVFAPPVTDDQADSLIRVERRTPGCRVMPGAPDFGSVSVGLICVQGRERVGAFHGLFGDAWLSCSLQVRAQTTARRLTDRTEQWCAEVARAAAEPVA